MRSAAFVLSLACALAAAVRIAAAASAPADTGAIAAALALAGKTTKLQAIDYGAAYCDGGMTVEAWLKALVGRDARQIRWSGGKCRLVSDLSPLDAASWRWCARARISLVHPKNQDDHPIIEIYFEQPAGGRAGPAYAFRGLLLTRKDGPDLSRFRKDFEAEWRARFTPAPGAAGCRD